jgi:hypothetical protein
MLRSQNPDVVLLKPTVYTGAIDTVNEMEIKTRHKHDPSMSDPTHGDTPLSPATNYSAASGSSSGLCTIAAA